MQLSVTGHHVEITDSMRSYLEKKLERVMRHFDQLLDVHCILSVAKLEQKAEATVHVRGETIHCVSVDTNMYAALDALADKLDARVRKYKEKATDHHAAEARAFLEKTRTAIKSASVRDPRRTWHRLELEVLLDEATQLITPPAAP